jgi:prevent-host-death family protein
MEQISKSRFKPHALEIMRRVEKTGQAIVITDHGLPVLELRPFRADVLQDNPADYLRDTVIKYEDPTEPVADDDWDAV